MQNYANDVIVEEENGKVSEIIAKRIGISPRTYEMAKVIIENAPEERKDKASDIIKLQSQRNTKTYKKIFKGKNYYLNFS